MNNKIILFLVIFAGTFLSCTKDITSLNDDEKRPYEAPPKAFFRNAQKNMTDILSSVNVNTNVFKLYAQQMSQCTYPDESQYNMTSRSIPGSFWNTMYRDVLRDLQEARTGIEATELIEPNLAEKKIKKQNQLNVIKIHEVMAYQMLVDVFGDVPRTEALDISNPLPKYDDDADTYYAVMAELKTAADGLDLSQGSMDNFDFVYGGNTEAWKKFGYSLLLKMAIRVADDNDATAKSMAEAAFAGGVFDRVSDNALFPYDLNTPNTNPTYVSLVLSGRKDFVGSNTMIDMMDTLLNDPRINKYFEMTDTSSVDTLVKMGYRGGAYGYANSYSKNSKLTKSLHKADFKGMLLTYSEVLFLLAEAKERGYSVGTPTAKDYYTDAITASFGEWGASDLTTYLAQPLVDYDTATGNWKQKIGTQKWISLFGRGLEAWTEWRRLDYPLFNIPDGLTYDDIPKRLIYPPTEATLNGDNYTTAANKFDNDSPTAKVFWDKN